FYRDTLGFKEQAQLPSAAFLAAGGYHHHIGLNSWQSQGAGPSPPSAPRLSEIRFTLHNGERPALVDPDGNTLSFSSPATAGARPARPDSASARDLVQAPELLGRELEAHRRD